MKIRAFTQPYDITGEHITIVQIIAQLLTSPPSPFDHAWLVTAYANVRGITLLKPHLMNAKAHGTKIHVVVGIDSRVTNSEALHALHSLQIDTHIFHNPQFAHTFHPKIYLFEATNQHAQLLMGSSNLTQGGLYTNYEAMLHISYDLTGEDIHTYQTIKDSLSIYLNPNGTTVQPLTLELIEYLAQQKPSTRHDMLPLSTIPKHDSSPNIHLPFAHEFIPKPILEGEPMPINSVELDALRRYFPEKDDDQLTTWLQTAHRVRQLNKLSPTLILDDDQRQTFNEHLMRADNLLQTDRPYTISVVGATGAGKSALINALVGDNILSSRDSAEAITGTIVTVRQMESPDKSLHRQATIFYYTFHEILQMINDYADSLGLNINQLDLNHQRNFQTLIPKLQQTLQRQSMTCPKCHEKNPPQTKFCVNCQIAINYLDDLLETMMHQHTKIDMGQETFNLNSEHDLERLRDSMDEKSPLNAEGNSSRFIPLIDHIEIEICSPELLQEGLFHVAWTDVPGIRASTQRHATRVREQLNPEKTDAIILVLAKGERFREGVKQLLDQIKRVIMGTWRETKKDIDAASRIFVVVNKGDLRHALRPLEEGIRKICADFSPNFLHEHGDNVFYDVKAWAALLAQLKLANPDMGATWLNGEQPSEGIFALYGMEDVHAYKSYVMRASDAHPNLSADAAVLAWSDIPKLRARLADFLRDSRFERDLQESVDRFHQAYHLAQSATNQAWHDIFHHPPSDDNPEQELQALMADTSAHYIQDLQCGSRDMQHRFEQACHNLRKIEEPILNQYLEQIRDDLLKKIKQHTATQSFRQKLVNMGYDTEFLQYDYGSIGDWTTLRTLDELVFGWLDDAVQSVSQAMIAALEKQIAYHDVLAFLKSLHGHSEQASRFLNYYQNDIMTHLQQVYMNSCRGACFCNLREYDVVRNIATEVKGFGNPVDKVNIETTQKGIIQMTYKVYEEGLNQFVAVLSQRLEELFFYQLTIAMRKVEKLVQDMQVQFILEVTNKEHRLYHYFQSRKAPEIERAKTLLNQLQQLRLIKE